MAVLFFLPMYSQAAGYDFYVDENSPEATENGTEQRPFKTIGAALQRIKDEKMKDKSIFIKKGTYEESLEVRSGTDLFGESESETVISATDKKNALSFISTSSLIKNLTISDADSTNIVIDKHSKVTIKDCTVEKAGKYGIEVEKSNTKERYKFTISGSSVTESRLQGVYVSERRVRVSGNEIFENDGEGIDLHSSVKGSVSGNDFHGNAESGIELILSGSSVKIRDNEVENNHTQGITVQAYSEKKGKVTISKNTIKGNSEYGIRYANYTYSLGPKKFEKFVKKYVKLFGNTNRDNNEGDVRYE